jgi:RNase H-fold protein (predicted Holliday junction resolvase)
MTGLAASTMRERSFLAFDFGTRRVGVASGNGLLRQASALRRSRPKAMHASPPSGS